MGLSFQKGKTDAPWQDRRTLSRNSLAVMTASCRLAHGVLFFSTHER